MLRDCNGTRGVRQRVWGMGPSPGSVRMVRESISGPAEHRVMKLL